jgi:PhnB protein
LSIDEAIFDLHEEKLHPSHFNPQHINGTTVLIRLFVSNADDVMAKAIDAGATVLSPAQSYDYRYRQREIKDPFGHVRLIEMNK